MLKLKQLLKILPVRWLGPSIIFILTFSHNFMTFAPRQMRIHIPRINAHFQPRNCSFEVHRKQIPLALCYATTFNGCQGLTVRRLVLDLRRPVFSHGQLYSAMTRVPDAINVLILKDLGDHSTRTTNIVWQELLL